MYTPHPDEGMFFVGQMGPLTIDAKDAKGNHTTVVRAIGDPIPEAFGWPPSVGQLEIARHRLVYVPKGVLAHFGVTPLELACPHCGKLPSEKPAEPSDAPKVEPKQGKKSKKPAGTTTEPVLVKSGPRAELESMGDKELLAIAKEYEISDADAAKLDREGLIAAILKATGYDEKPAEPSDAPKTDGEQSYSVPK